MDSAATFASQALADTMVVPPAGFGAAYAPLAEPSALESTLRF